MIKDEVPEKMFYVVDLVVAHWSEDNVWYNAEVLALMPGKAKVVFIDYKNMDVIDDQCILANPLEIPNGDTVDQNIVIPTHLPLTYPFILFHS